MFLLEIEAAATKYAVSKFGHRDDDTEFGFENGAKWAIKKSKIKENYSFQQGFLCAVAALIQSNRGVETQTKELFKSGAGSYNIKNFRKWGIDEHDIKVFKEYRKELI